MSSRDEKDEDEIISNDPILYSAQPKDKYNFRIFHHQVRFDEAFMSRSSVGSPFLATTYLGEIPILSNSWMASKDDKLGGEDFCPTLPIPEDELQDEKKEAEGKDDELDDDKDEPKNGDSKDFGDKASYERERIGDRFAKDYK